MENARRAVGSILLFPEMLDRVSPVLSVDDIPDPGIRALYSAMLELAERGDPVCDTALLQSAMEKKGTWHVLGGAIGLSQAMDVVPTGVHAEHYARLAAEEAVDARVRQSVSAAQAAIEAGDSPQRVAGRLSAELEARAPVGAGGSSVADVLAEISSRPSEYISTGYHALDLLHGGGLEMDSLTIVAAAPSVGKSQLAINIALGAKKSNGEPASVLYISYEMGDAMLADRMVATLGGVDSQAVRALRMGNALPHTVASHGDSYRKGVESLRRRPLHFFTKGSLNPSEYRRLVTYYHRKVDLVVLDYLQLCRGSSPKHGAKERVQEMSGEAKGVAKSYGIPCIAISSLSRGGYSEASSRPQLAHLKESGDVEYDADSVWMLWREKSGGSVEEMELHVRKNRNGPLSMIPLTYNLPTGKIQQMSL